MSTYRTKTIQLQADIKINVATSQPSKPRRPHQPLPTAIFLHYWGGSIRTWSLVSPLVSAEYPTVALDFRGWGDSVGPDAADAYSIAALASDVEAVIAALRLDAVVLVGLSMGAKVAQLLAARLSSSSVSNSGSSESRRLPLLRGVILLSPAPPTPLALPPEMREQQIHAYDNANSAAFVATNVLTASFQAAGGRTLPDFVVCDMLRGNRWSREAWPAYAMAEDVSDRKTTGGDGVVRIAAPVLVLAAEKDVVEPLERVRREVCGRIPGSRLEILPGSGHLSPLDAPEAVVGSILQFLEGL